MQRRDIGDGVWIGGGDLRWRSGGVVMDGTSPTDGGDECSASDAEGGGGGVA